MQRHMDSSYDVKPQLIAEAIAAFAVNNQTRQQTFELLFFLATRLSRNR
jgi:hypothetical protein